MTTIHIIHTNDFHSRLTEAGAARLKEVVASLNGEPYLLLDAGDAVRAGNIGVNPFGEPILDVMSDLGYHAMTMGNREFHVWNAALSTKINRARFPILCANIRAKGDANLPHPVQEHALFTVGGLKVAVFGVTVPMVTERMKVAALSSFLFDDPIKVAQRKVAELRFGSDVLIGLTHIGFTQDVRLAEAVPGMDLIIGGHSHSTLVAPRVVNKTPLVQTGMHGRFYGHTRLDIDSSGAITTTYTLCPLQEMTVPTENVRA